MGYTHDWDRPKTLPKKQFIAFGRDVQRIIEHVHRHGCLVQNWYCAVPGDFRTLAMQWVHRDFRIRDGDGVGEPEITADLVAFNGDNELPEIPGGCWGDDYHQGCESLWIPRVLTMGEWRPKPVRGRYPEFCKTERRPYDTVVAACLMAFERHFPEAVILGSDGDHGEWYGGRELIRDALGYEGVGVGSVKELVEA